MNSTLSITNSLKDYVTQFNELVINLNETEFENNPQNKWSAGQDLVHLIKVLQIVNIAFKIPAPILLVLFGKNKRESRSFDELQTLYKKSLEGGAKSPNLYIPKPVLFKNKTELLQKNESLNEAFIQKINKHSDDVLDNYRLPHPILGKVSLRELALFTSFHTLHHLELLKKKLNK